MANYFCTKKGCGGFYKCYTPELLEASGSDKCNICGSPMKRMSKLRA